MRHSTEATRTYPCLQCGGDLEFAIGIQQLACPFCGNVQTIDEARDAVVEQDLERAMSQLAETAAGRTSVVAGEKEVVCQNCGGHTTFTGSLTATRCPYCATPIQRDDVHDAPARLNVDGVLPFGVDQTQADAAIGKWIQSRWFAPSEFKKYATKGSFTSVYCAYFTFDADTTTDYRGQRGDNYTVTVGSGENRRTEVRTRWTNVAGTVGETFDDLPVFANEGLDRAKVQALEPWPTQDARPYNAEFVAGHLCRTYDLDLPDCFGVAKGRMTDEIRDSIRRDIGGDHQRIGWMSTTWDDLTYKHLLLPIWLLTVLYAGKPFQVVINGVTGEVQGQRPYSAIKIAAAVFVAAVVAIGLYVLYRSSGYQSGGTTR